MSNNVEINKKNIRQIIRKHRQQLTCQEQYNAAYKITKIVLGHKLIQSASNIGLFLPFDGEINTFPLIKTLWNKNKKIYLPRLHPSNNHQLLFLQYCPNTILIKNCFDIAEPKLNVTDIISITQLDVLFVPLVAFDEQGQRLGMGGGFYDKLLLNWGKYFFPIGLAHECQLVKKIPILSWDIPLPEIITPLKIRRW